MQTKRVLILGAMLFAANVFAEPKTAECPFASDKKCPRGSVDLPFKADLSTHRGIAFDLEVSNPRAFSNFTVYFKSGDGWYLCNCDCGRAGEPTTIMVDREDAAKKTEGTPSGWDKIELIRVSGWRGTAMDATITVDNLRVNDKAPVVESPEHEAAFVASQVDDSRPGEVRAFWCHSPLGLGKDYTWEESIAFLATNGFNSIVVNLTWPLRAAYPSKVVPVDRRIPAGRDMFAECKAACRKYGVKMHVWKVCWNCKYEPKDLQAKLREEGRFQKTIDGEELPWLCPSDERNLASESEAFLELAKMRPDGIHFDYIRYDNDGCFCERCHKKFVEFCGHEVAGWPKKVKSDDALWRKWNKFRCQQITALVKNVAERVRKEAPGVKLSAAVFRKHETTPNTVGQDWFSWCKAGYLDFVCPMDYTNSNVAFEVLMEEQQEVAKYLPVYPGIGLSSTSAKKVNRARKVAEQIAIARKAGYKGFTIFNFDKAAIEILPLIHRGPVK